MRDGFKQTEIGEIPEDWDVISLGDYVDITSGESPSKLNLVSSGIPYFKVEQLNYDSKYIRKTPYFFEEGKTVPKGSVIFPKRGASILLNKIRIIAQDSFMDTNLMALTARGELFGEYLFYCLDYMGLVNVADTTSIPQINNKHIKPFKIPLPKKSEQKKIARCLSDADQLIIYLEKLIAKKRYIKTGTMQQLLTGKKRLPNFGEGKGYKQTELGEIPEDWDVLPIGELLEVRHGKSQKDVVDPNGDYPILATGGEIGRANRPLYTKPSVLIGRKGTIDRPFYMATPFWSVDTLFYSEVSENVDAKFLFYKFLFIDWRQYNEASGVPSLSSKTIESIEQAIPSEKDEQIAISTVLSGFDHEIDSLNAQLQKARQIKKGMMQELLTGRTRLVDVDTGEQEERMHGT